MWTREGKVEGDELGYLVKESLKISIISHLTFFLVGVASTGAGVENCANLNNPGDKICFVWSNHTEVLLSAIYTKIKYYLSWIKKHAADGRCSSATSQG